MKTARTIYIDETQIRFVNFDSDFEGEGTVCFNIYPTSVSIVKGNNAEERPFGFVTRYENNCITDKVLIEKLLNKGIKSMCFNKVADCYLQA